MPEKQILSITEQGIRYQGEDGIEKFIDFAICYENYLKHQLDPENLNQIKDEDLPIHTELIKSIKEVALYDLTWTFLEFYTDPIVSLEFTNEATFIEAKHTIEN